MTRIAVIGAGLSGLVVARRLNKVADVTVFEKSRGPGGRMATRYADEYEFDHGAQFFIARTADFRAFLQPLIADNVVANWAAQFAELDRGETRKMRSWGSENPHYVGTPRMNDIGKYLSRGVEILTNTRIEAIERTGTCWTVTDSDRNEFGYYDWVILTAPAPQTAVLGAAFPDLVEICNKRSMQACFALMLGFAEKIDLEWQAALVRNADISWISVNSSKPRRKTPFTLLVHSTNAWADMHIDDDFERIKDHMLEEASLACGVDLRQTEHRELHRWRYANADKHHGQQFYIDGDTQLAACGDWLVRGRVEAAFTSASQLSDQLFERLVNSP